MSIVVSHESHPDPVVNSHNQLLPVSHDSHPTKAVYFYKFAWSLLMPIRINRILLLHPIRIATNQKGRHQYGARADQRPII